MLMPYLPSQVLQYHRQNVQTSCGASGAEVVLKCHEKLLSKTHPCKLNKYGGANIGFEKEEELTSRGISRAISARLRSKRKANRGRIKGRALSAVSLPTNLDVSARKLWCHLFIAEPGSKGLKILDPANGSVLVEGDVAEVAAKIDSQRAMFHDVEDVN